MFVHFEDFAPLLIVLGLLYPVACILRSIVLEKQLRQKELMKVMSVPEAMIGWSWFTSYFLFHLVTAVCMTAASASLYENSSFVILLVFWMLALIAIIVFSFAIASLFTRATAATLVGLLLFFAGFILTISANFETGSSWIIALVSIHPVAAIAYGMQEIGRLEDAGVGLTSSTISITDSPSGYTFATTITSLMLSSIIWGLFTFFFNRVMSCNNGLSLPWYFLCTRSYWCNGRSVVPDELEDLDDTSCGIPLEDVSDAARTSLLEGKGIAIRGLRKKFGDKTAVDKLNLTMYTNQITALLGMFHSVNCFVLHNKHFLIQRFTSMTRSQVTMELEKR